MKVSMKRSLVVTSVLWSRSYTEADCQHLFKVSRLFITCYYIFVSYYGLFILDLSDVDHPLFVNLGTNWWCKCISVWNLISYFIHCTVFVDFVDLGSGKTWLKSRLQWNKQLRDFAFISVVFPMTLEVCTMFWVICIINKPLLFPNEMNNWVPEWFNHAVHTNPIVLALFEITTTKHHLPKITESTIGLFALSSSYVTCLLYIKYTTGRWVYLIIGEVAVSWLEVAMYFIVTAFIIPFICMMIGYKISSWFSNLQIKEKQKVS